MVFHANMALRERGETRVIWGITLRAGPTEKQILGVPLAETRIAVPQGDTMAETWLTSYRYPHLTEVEIRPTIRVLRPTAFAPPGPPRGIGLNGPVTPVLPYIRHD